MTTTIHERSAARRPRVSAEGWLHADRRRFLQSSLSAIGAYAVAVQGITWIVGPGKAWAVQYDVLEPHVAETLLAMTRALYPHDFLGDAHYAKVVKDLDSEASGFQDKSRTEVLRAGVVTLDEKAGGSFLKASPDQREQALKAIEGTEFFGAVRTKTVVGLYNQQEVWEKFGYEGSSFEYGGYIFRGFNDLRWLPDPPPEASPRVQI